MAELTDFLTNIANAIREKTSKTGKIKASDFASEIKGISTGDGFDTTQIRQTAYMFKGNTTMTDAPYFDTSNVTDMEHMFQDCSNLKTVPLYNTVNATNISYMFSKCKSLTTVPLFDTSNVTNISNMFDGCENLLTVPKFNTTNVTTFLAMFRECRNIKEIPQLDTSNATNLQYFVQTCPILETIPLLECGKVTNIYYMFRYSSRLINVGGLKDIGKAYTQKTENYTYYAITISSNYITHESLMNIINNLYDLNLTYNVANGGTLYRQKLDIGTTNITKLTDEEIKIATDKGWNVT